MGARARRIAIGLIPHGLVSLLRTRRDHQTQLARLGATTRDPAKGALAREWRLTLLPPGALSELTSVIDIGANVGDWSRAVLALSEPGRLIAVEPQPGIAKQLGRSFADRPEVTVVQAAVGATGGQVELQIASHPHNASMLAPRESMNDLYGGTGWSRVGTITVPMITLDELAGDLPEVSLVKLDVQGVEADVIQGGRSTLRRTRWLLIEVCFRSHYEGDTLFPDLHGQLSAAGFDLIAVSEPRLSQDGRPLWADALYERSTAA
jgi:FkbM family methyltransferase